MKYLASYLLLGLGGNTSPSASDIKGAIAPFAVQLLSTDQTTDVLESVGLDVDDERIEKLRMFPSHFLSNHNELMQNSVRTKGQGYQRTHR